MRWLLSYLLFCLDGRPYGSFVSVIINCVDPVGVLMVRLLLQIYFRKDETCVA